MGVNTTEQNLGEIRVDWFRNALVLTFTDPGGQMPGFCLTSITVFCPAPESPG